MFRTSNGVRQTAFAAVLSICSLSAFQVVAEQPASHPAHDQVISAQSVSTLAPWGAAGHVVAADNMYFAAQPDARGFTLAAQAGVTSVINIRGAEEVDWDVRAAVEQAGMAYYNEPLVLGKQGIDEASALRISELINQSADGKVLVHCASGNRVAIWWAIHLVRDHKMSDSAAIALAQLAGMKPQLAPMLQAHFNPGS